MPRKSQFTEQQIIQALQEVDAGDTAADVCRRLGVAEATFYRPRSPKIRHGSATTGAN